MSGPISSTYWWELKLETTDEWVCTFKTSALALEPLKTVLRETQGYMGFTTPEIVAVPIENGDTDYLAWIDAETSGPRPVQLRTHSGAAPLRNTKVSATRCGEPCPGSCAEGVDEVHLARPFVGCQALRRIGEERFDVGRRHAVGNDPGADDLTPLLRRRAGDGHLGHRRMPEKDVLDFGGVDVVATGDDELGGATEETDVPVLDDTEVTGAEPPVVEASRCRRGSLPVAGEHRGPRTAAPSSPTSASTPGNGDPTVPGRRSPS